MVSWQPRSLQKVNMAPFHYEEPVWILEIKAAYPEAFKDLFEFGFACDEGWRDLILWTLARMVSADPKIRVHQIKEKFGELRIYSSSDNEDACRAGREATALSVRICEHCGQPGALITSRPRWVTLCDDCVQEST